MVRPAMLCLLNIVTMCSLLGSPASAEDYFYYYLDEPIPLTTTPNTLAVYDKAQGQDDALRRVFEDAQIEMTQMQSHPIGAGWHTVTLPDEEANAFGGPPGMIPTLAQHGVGRFFFSPVFLGPSGSPVIVPPEVLVLFEDSVKQSDVAQLLHQSGVRGANRETFAQSLGMAFKVSTNHDSGVEVLEIANRLNEMSEVTFAEPDMIISGKPGDYVPNEPDIGLSWGLRNYAQFTGAIFDFDIQAEQAWCGDPPNEPEFGDPNVITVIIDTGVQQDHPEINQIPGRDFTSDGGDGGPVNKCDNHGTPVAGVISGKVNFIGTAGVAPYTKIASARVFISNTNSTNCDTGWITQYSWTADALQWSLEIGARITNNSNFYNKNIPSTAITQMYKHTYNEMLHFASAGNSAIPEIEYPAELSFIQAVTAMDWDGSLASFSNFGSEVVFTAPGVTILTTDRTPPNGWAPSSSTIFGNGTSFSSPMAAGVAALTWSQDLQQTPFDILHALTSTARDLGVVGRDDLFGFGLVDAGRAVKVPPLGILFIDDFETGSFTKWSSAEN